MARILAIDYGLKRTGIAVTDPLQIIATGLTTIETKTIWVFLKNYFATELVEKVVIGEPKNLDGTDTHGTKPVEDFIKKFKKDFPAMPIIGVDESYSSKNAVKALIASGVKKKDRQVKGRIDEMAATIILQEYMGIFH